MFVCGCCWRCNLRCNYVADFTITVMANVIWTANGDHYIFQLPTQFGPLMCCQRQLKIRWYRAIQTVKNR